MARKIETLEEWVGRQMEEMKEEIVSGKSDRLAIRKSAARRMNEAGKRLMTYGSWDGSKKQLLSWMRDNLDVIRLATFESPEEQAAFKKKLDENTLAKWSGCYTPWMGWGNETPTAVRKKVTEEVLVNKMDKETGQKIGTGVISIEKTIIVNKGWPEKYTWTEREWQMSLEGLRGKRFDEWVEEMKKQYGEGSSKKVAG